jgi:hypothetical protein
MFATIVHVLSWFTLKTWLGIFGTPCEQPAQIYSLCYGYAVSGDTTHAKLVMEKILKEYSDQNPLMLAYIYITLKNYDEALNMLEAAYKTRNIQLYWIKVDPILDPIRNEPRLKALLAKMHLE